MERIQRNCRELFKVYQREEVNSPKAAAFRNKIFRLLREAESETDGNIQAVELFWKTAYYDPICNLKRKMDNTFLSYMIDIFIGEITTYITRPSRNVAYYYVMLGDLMRYIKSPLAAIQYRKAIEANPELGKAFNQLALQDKGIKSIRFFLLSQSAKETFKLAADNLKRSLDDSSENELFNHAKNIIKLMNFEMKRQELSSEFSKLIDKIEEQEADSISKTDDLPLIIDSIVIAHDILPSRLGDDYFLVPISHFCELFSLLLKKYRAAPNPEEGISAGQRRRQLSSGSTKSRPESDSEASIDEQESYLPDHSEVVTWPASLCCQWLIKTTCRLATFQRDITPVPASIREALNDLTDKLIECLNNFQISLSLKLDESATDEADWLLNGPVDNEANQAQRQLAFWIEMIISCEECDIEFTTYFRRKKEDTSIIKKMGLLLVDQVVQKKEDNVWIPVYIVPDYSVMEKHLAKLRTITSGNTVFLIIPSFLLAELDRMKSTGPHIRDAMRFIEKKQACGELKVVNCKSYMECAQELTKKVDKIEKIEGPLTGLLATDVTKHKNIALEGSLPYRFFRNLHVVVIELAFYCVHRFRSL